MKYTIRFTLALACALLTIGSTLSLPFGDIRTLYDWSDLPTLGTGHITESSNTWGPGAGKLTDVAPGQSVLLDTKGPGCITRISIYAGVGTLKVYLDGATTPQIDIPLKLLHQQYPMYDPAKVATVDKDFQQQFPFLLPLNGQGSGQRNYSYIPIPFAQSAKVVLEHDPKNPWIQYSILTAKYPAGTKVQTYSPQEMQARQAEVWAAAKAFRNMGQPPMDYPDAKKQAGSMIVPARSTVDLWKSDGSGTVVGIRLRALPWHKAVDRLLVLRAYWDGESRPSVEAPLGDFCASHGGIRSTLVLPVGGGGKGNWYWCYLPMPFAKGARLTLENMSAHPIPTLEYEIAVRPGQVAPNAGRFCARWKRVQEIGDDGKYELLNATGAGKLIGYNMYITGFTVPQKNYRQTDRMALYRDDETEPSLAKSSLLVYFNNGWYTGATWESPLAANQEMDNFIYGKYSDYRFFLNDAPDWSKSVRLQMEVKIDGETGKDFSSTAYWYKTPGATDTFAPLKRAEILLPVRKYPGSIEAESLLATTEITRGDLMLVDDPDSRFGVGNNQYLSYAPLGFGDQITFTLPVDKAGTYEVRIRLVAGPSGGYWNTSVNGSPVNPDKPVSCTWEETLLAYWHHPDGWQNLGAYDLRAGDNTVTFISRSPYIGAQQRGLLLGMDAFLLQPVVKK
ncbi:MAG: DUF2961 domain-containing protein [Armatimonadota bacterium]